MKADPSLFSKRDCDLGDINEHVGCTRARRSRRTARSVFSCSLFMLDENESLRQWTV